MAEHSGFKGLTIKEADGLGIHLTPRQHFTLGAEILYWTTTNVPEAKFPVTIQEREHEAFITHVVQGENRLRQRVFSWTTVLSDRDTSLQAWLGLGFVQVGRPDHGYTITPYGTGCFVFPHIEQAELLRIIPGETLAGLLEGRISYPRS